MTICEHIKDNGSTCGSPALTGYSFCFFHQRLRQPRHRPGDFEYKLPILDTPESILMATQHITQAALDGILEPSRARLVLSALRLAKSTLKQMKREKKVIGNGDTAEFTDALQNVDTGFQARVPRAPLAVLPAENTIATQLKLMKKILRRGPSDPRFTTAARLLDHQIAAGHH